MSDVNEVSINCEWNGLKTQDVRTIGISNVPELTQYGCCVDRCGQRPLRHCTQVSDVNVC